MRIIGLSGRAGSGKDTAYGYIEELAAERGLTAHREGFADRLKISAARALGFEGSDEECIEYCNALKGEYSDLTVEVLHPEHGHAPRTISGREFLQWYGTEAHRDVFGKDFWIDAVLGREYPGVDILVITDVRFDNEAEAVLDAWRDRREPDGGPGRSEVWEIIRDFSPPDAHASEQPLPDHLVTWRVYNTEGLEEFREAVRRRL